MGAAELQASGQIISVVPQSDGWFGVLLGPAPNLYWYLTTTPPKLGTLVSVSGQVSEQTNVQGGLIPTVLTKLDRVTVQYESPPYPTRVLSPEWVSRVNHVMRRPLYRYQVEGAAWLAGRIANGQGGILADDPGLGKSAQTVAALCATRMFPCLLVCPTTLKFNWVREFGWANEPPSVHIVSGRTGELPEAQVYITNYDLLRGREEQFTKLGARTMVLDEAQAVKEPEAGQYHRATIAGRLAHWVFRVIELTGTPIMNRPRDLWHLLYLVDPAEWPSFRDFENQYCKAPQDVERETGRRVVTSYGRVEHLDELQTLIQPVLLRRLKTEVLPYLPPKSRRSILVGLDEIAMADYHAAKRDIIAWLRAVDTGDAARRAIRAEAFVRLTALRKLAAMGKVTKHGPVREYLDQWFDQSDMVPLVIFAFHRDVILKLHGDIIPAINMARREEKPPPPELHLSLIGGGDSPLVRQDAIDRFQAGETDLFIAPIKCGGAGINLQRASDALFIERTWTPSEMTQAEDRIHRLDTVRPVTITYLDAVDTIDERLAEVIEAKQLLIRHILDEEQPVGESTAVLDSILDAFKNA